MTETRILLADDHALIRAGIRSLLHESENLKVVAEACNGREALALAETHRPDVAILDITMPELDGLEATQQIKQAFPGVLVLILSAHNEREFVAHALKVGASGYLLKDAATEELAFAVRVAQRGQIYLAPSVSGPIIEKYIQTPSRQIGPNAALTPRLTEILKLIAEGNGTKEISFELGISVKTVEAHRAILMERLKIRDIAGLVRHALRVGLISIDT